MNKIFAILLVLMLIGCGNMPSKKATESHNIMPKDVACSTVLKTSGLTLQKYRFVTIPSLLDMGVTDESLTGDYSYMKEFLAVPSWQALTPEDYKSINDNDLSKMQLVEELNRIISEYNACIADYNSYLKTLN